MNIPVVKEFFNNKITIQLKNGHKFQGLLSTINYKNQTIILQDVEDLGNNTDKNFIPHDKKIVEKAFEGENIEEIIFKQKHFCEPKKYNKDEFWDAISQPVAQDTKPRQKPYNNRGDRNYQKKHYGDREGKYENRDNREYRGRNDNRGGYNKDRGYQERGGYQQKGEYRKRDEKPYQKKEDENDRDYR